MQDLGFTYTLGTMTLKLKNQSIKFPALQETQVKRALSQEQKKIDDQKL